MTDYKVTDPGAIQMTESQANLGKSTEALDVDECDSDRGTWGSPVEFLLSCLGYAVGLGNIWRFPYVCYDNGGGAFLIPYGIMLAFCGLPLFFMELSLGQYSASGPMKAYEFSPLLQGIGAGMVVISILGSIYYNLIIAWSLYYMVASFTSNLPWQDCSNAWNSYKCYSKEEEARCLNTSVGTGSNTTVYYNATCFQNISVSLYEEIKSLTNSSGYQKTLQSPTEEYFNRYMLNRTDKIEDMGSLKWDMTLALFAAWILAWLCVVKGIQSSGKVVYFTATFPYLVILILLITGATLENAAEGVRYYIQPNFTKLGEAKVWGAAAGQIFFSLSVGMGGLMTFASYNRFHNNVLRDSYIVALGNCATSVVAGFAIFSILGYMAKVKNVNVSDVVNSGSGLAFIAYPEVILHLPAPPFWSFIFFFMLITLGLDSQFAGIENIGNAVMDMYPHLRPKKTHVNTAVCVILFILGLPLCTRGGIYWEELMSAYSSGWSLVLIGLAEGIAVAYVYGFIGKRDLIDDIEYMIGYRPSRYWRICWLGVTPVLLVAVLIFNFVDYAPLTYGDYKFPPWANAIGWLMAFASVACIPVVAVYNLLTRRSPDLTIAENVILLLKPSENWLPSIEKNRRKRLERQAHEMGEIANGVQKNNEMNANEYDGKPRGGGAPGGGGYDNRASGGVSDERPPHYDRMASTTSDAPLAQYRYSVASDNPGFVGSTDQLGGGGGQVGGAAEDPHRYSVDRSEM